MTLYIKRLIAILIISFVIIVQSIPIIHINAENDEDSLDLTFGTYVTSGTFSIDQLLKQARWLSNPNGGRGYAAEEANNLIDVLHGIDATVVGNNNAKNGPDRRIVGRDGQVYWIQDKYYSTASNSINASFGEDGYYKYVNSDGSPMILEVPADQYDQSIELFKKKIIEGKVKGVTNPDDAENIVKKGNLTYDQVVNLTKAGNIESLKYDATNSCVTALTAFGIGTTLDYVIRIHNGENYKQALKESAIVGLKTGSRAFAISVITLQLAKTSVVNIFTPTSEALVNVFGDKFAEALINAYGINSVGQSSRTVAVNFLKTQALAQTVMLIVIEIPDVIDMIEGRISGQQLIKNIGVTLAGIVGGTAGYFLGSTLGGGVAPGAGNVIGGLLGSFAGGGLASYLADLGFSAFIIEDAEIMLDIIEEEFYKLCEEYLITEEEGVMIADKIGSLFTPDVLKDMYASKDKHEFAREKLISMFEETITTREKIEIPTDSEMRYELKDSLKGVVYVH